jgi:hypothetical protein
MYSLKSSTIAFVQQLLEAVIWAECTPLDKRPFSAHDRRLYQQRQGGLLSWRSTPNGICLPPQVVLGIQAGPSCFDWDAHLVRCGCEEFHVLALTIETWVTRGVNARYQDLRWLEVFHTSRVRDSGRIAFGSLGMAGVCHLIRHPSGMTEHDERDWLHRPLLGLIESNLTEIHGWKEASLQYWQPDAQAPSAWARNLLANATWLPGWG